ncbi:MAG TPA: helix-turn-helix domain-containing protein, partial [Phycisphaerales bacterium]|nr:helix-turn-helix domain-containing protein [Phycisphaerales bacterium]
LMKQLLLETDVSVERIAYSLGYPSADHIARYFQQHAHMSPSQYRASHHT